MAATVGGCYIIWDTHIVAILMGQYLMIAVRRAQLQIFEGKIDKVAKPFSFPVYTVSPCQRKVCYLFGGVVGGIFTQYFMVEILEKGFVVVPQPWAYTSVYYGGS